MHSEEVAVLERYAASPYAIAGHFDDRLIKARALDNRR